MNPYLRYALIVFAVVITLLAGLMIYIAAIFDPNAYKPQISQLVKEKKQRNLRLDGDIKLAFFPSLGAEVRNLSLSEYNSDKEFATAENIFVSLALMPLLKKQLAINEIAISGLKANLIRFKDGRTNIDDLIARSEEPEQFKIDIDRVRVEKTLLALHDEASGEQYMLRDLNLRADGSNARSHSKGNSLQHKVELAFRASQASQPGTDLVTRLGFELVSDFEEQFYTLDGLNLEVNGAVAGINNLVVRSKGDLSIKPAADEFVANKITLGITGTSGTNNLDIKFDAPRLSLAREMVAGDKITLTAKITRPEGNASGILFLSGVAGTVTDFESKALTVELESKEGELAVRATLASPLTGNLDTRQLKLPDLTAVINANGPEIPGNGISGNLLGSAAIDGVSQNVQANLTGKLMESNVRAKLGATGFVQPAFNFEVEIDQLDVDRFLPKQKQKKHAEKAENGKTLEESLGLSALKDLKVRGTIRIGLLKGANVTSSNVKLDINP
ncbi:AsmA family protein [Nitrosospira lacus]|uniref:AsmA family protein n=1 Tax=Nitrosospira lacus TaxID=1288494 RepID=A0A1W6SLK9_9PROT|nr:AsmA family protein [Nitrosospira lacus]ARO86689.1 AsmA family protein [Nitrosospira lacus]